MLATGVLEDAVPPPSDLFVRSSNYHRTQQSVQSLLAGLLGMTDALEEAAVEEREAPMPHPTKAQAHAHVAVHVPAPANDGINSARGVVGNS